MRLSPSVIVLSLFVIAAFGPPTPWPDSLDDLYRFIDTGAPGWTFTYPCPVQPELTWSMVKEITAANVDGDLDRIGIDLTHAGMLDISEKELFGIAIWSVFGGAWKYGYNPVCKPPDDKVAVYGQAAFDIFGQLEEYVK